MKPISRRTMLGRTGLLWAGAILGSGQAGKSSQAAPEPGTRNKLKIVVTGGHPGDPEYGCGGTVARFSDLGHEVVLLYLNRGDPSEKPGATGKGARVAEAEKACGILKARPLYAGQIDGHAVVDAEHYEQFRRLLEGERPDAVFTHWPIDNHADHRAIAMLVYDAWARLGRKFAFYYYEVSDGEDTLQFAPTHYVDITAAESRKRSACYAHASQAPDKFYALQELVSRMRGVESGHRQAEAFIHQMQSPELALP